MEINLSKDSVVDQRTGEVGTPSEYVENLRAIETSIARADEDIASLKSDLKAAKDAREGLVQQLRAAVREGRVLPLFEVEAEIDDGLRVKDEGLDSEDD